MKKIEGSPKNLKQLLQNTKYSIHYYQREYMWQRKHIEELIDDLTSEFLEYYHPGASRLAVTFYDKSFESEDESVSSTIESLYVENCMMFLDITSSKEGEDSIRQQVILNRVEYGKPAESESEKIREVSEMEELVEFSWHQSAMSYNGCFDFQITSSEQESAAPHLYCSYTDPETYECIEVGEESYGFQGVRLDGTRTDSAACPTVPLESWEELADFLHTAKLSPPTTRWNRVLWTQPTVRSKSHGRRTAKSLPTATVVSMPTSC